MTLPLRSELLTVHPYGAPQIDVPVRLNTNENPYSPPAELIADIAANVAAVANQFNRYPDRDAVELRQALAHYLSDETGVSVNRENVWAANGSNEIMLQLLQAFGGPGHTALTFSPTYSMYEEYARDTNTEFVAIPRNSDFSVDAQLIELAIRDHSPQVIFFASPNNPTGTAMDLPLIEVACRLAPDAVIVVDEAYAEFRREGVPSAVSLLEKHPQLVVTRTMSKAFAFAGVRLGYLAASPEVIAALLLVRLPYHLSTVTQTVATTAIKHASRLQKDLAEIRRERDELVTWLRANGLEAADSDANFVLFGQFSDRHATWQALVDRGVLIREVGPAGWLRVTIGTSDEMKVFKQALMDVEGLSS